MAELSVFLVCSLFDIIAEGLHASECTLSILLSLFQLCTELILSYQCPLKLSASLFLTLFNHIPYLLRIYNSAFLKLILSY